MATKIKYILIFSLIIISISFGIFQSGVNFKTEEVSAVTTGTPNPGHTWSLMECSGDSLCIDLVGNKLGIGTNTPSQKLEVNGNIKLGGASPSYTVSNVAAPISSSDVATKDYVDAAGGGTWETCYLSWLTSGTTACASGFTTLSHYTHSGGWYTDSGTGATNATAQTITVGGGTLTYMTGRCHSSYANQNDCIGNADSHVFTDSKPWVIWDGSYRVGINPGSPWTGNAESIAICCK